ncbi:cation efflux family protein [Necator americanus]|uniref:Cation efflux family protein n=1 Tax=Necator americanus TaxID=51031 RepID=W2TDK8_NECAM|nr:cation efflux family protein [Necator americanus]ETN79251.1 cation efflux family protein [Necator americanus]
MSESTALLNKNLNSVSYDSTQLNNGNYFHCHDEPSKDDQAKSAKAIRILWISVVICLFFMTCEVIGGFWAKSLAIVTDAAHLVRAQLFWIILTDFASMLISLFSIYIATKKPSQQVLGAFFSVFLIWIVTGVLVILAILRMINKDYDIDSTVMAITATIGVCVNLIMGALLYFGGHSHSHGGGAHGHSHSHRVGSGSSAENGRPSTIDFSNVFTSLEQINGVKKVHDLRIWALTMDKVCVPRNLLQDI